MEGFRAPVSSLRRALATGGKDREVRFWNPSTGQRVQTLRLGEEVVSLAFSPDGRLLAVGCMGRAMRRRIARLIDVDIHGQSSTKQRPAAWGRSYSLAWSEVPDGRYLAGCGQYGLALWKVPKAYRCEWKPFKLDRSRECLATVLNREAGVLVWAEEENSENRPQSLGPSALVKWRS